MDLKYSDPRAVDELMRKNLLVKHLAGSHAYGTNIPSSDTDYRGLFVADPVNILTPFFPVREANDVSEEDTKFYELAHFTKLCLDCNPNIVETLWVDDADVVYATEAYEHLRSHRERLLSSKVAFTFSGYAVSQLKRIKGHNKWINNPQPEKAPMPCEYMSVVQWMGANKNLHPNIDDYKIGHRLVPFGGEVYGIARDKYRSLWDAQGGLNDLIEQGDREHYRDFIMIVKWNKQIYKEAKENHRKYWEWKNNRNETRSELEEEHGYDCYSDDTEFLTDSGWKLFDDICKTDTLATFNQYTHAVEYQSYSERIEGLYTGNMYNLLGQHRDCLVTANHNMVVRPYSRKKGKEGNWEFCRAAELPETFDTLSFIKPRKKRNYLPKGFPSLAESGLDILNFLRIVGWYVSDGTTQFRDGNVKAIVISQSKPQSKLTQTLSKQLNAGKIDCNHYLYEATGLGNYPEHRWTFPKHVSQIIYEECGHGSNEKRLPNWAFFLTKREMTTLLIALLQGDGSKRNHQQHTHVYYSKNYNLAGDVQRLAMLCGFQTSLWGPYDDGMCQVCINMKPTHGRTTRDIVQKEYVIDKRIVCFMVSNLTLITRRNGKVSFHANTKHAMHLVRLLRMGEEILSEGVVRVKRPDAEELLSIRNGAWSYEKLLEYADKMDNDIRGNLYKTTGLRKKADVKFAAKLLMEVQELVWN